MSIEGSTITKQDNICERENGQMKSTDIIYMYTIDTEALIVQSHC